MAYLEFLVEVLELNELTEKKHQLTLFNAIPVMSWHNYFDFFMFCFGTFIKISSCQVERQIKQK